MRYRKVPHTELVVSELGLGTMNFGGQVSKSTSFSLLDQATKEYGINLIVSLILKWIILSIHN